MHSYFNERHSRSMKMLSRNRPRPSIEIRTPASFRRCVHVRLRLRRGATPLEYLRRAVKQRLLPLVDHRRVNLKPARQLGNGLFTL
jgi:hypothetical protein